MNRIAYLANSFPEAIESYVWEEVCELRKRGRTVSVCSFRRPHHLPEHLAGAASETSYVFPLRMQLAIHACWMCISRLYLIGDLLWRAVRGSEPIQRRLRTIVHTWLGGYLAAALHKERIAHIHVHHGYFSSWAGMVAARLLGATFIFTLHGSDLLVRGDYLDCKLNNCRFCITVSEFNRNYIREHFPAMDPDKILVHRLGIDLEFWRPLSRTAAGSQFSILSVGRLQAVKNYEFLIHACVELKAAGLNFRCRIAGEGEERGRLQDLIRKSRLENEIELLGRISRERLPSLYSQADVVALTSHSEGIPQTLMEAMAMERVVLAPAITGIPELIVNEQTGFLYQPNSMPDFLVKLAHIAAASLSLNELRQEARQYVEFCFNRQRNLDTWAQDFVQRVDRGATAIYANPVLQQVQLPVQRDRSIPV